MNAITGSATEGLGPMSSLGRADSRGSTRLTLATLVLQCVARQGRAGSSLCTVRRSLDRGVVADLGSGGGWPLQRRRRCLDSPGNPARRGQPRPEITRRQRWVRSGSMDGVVASERPRRRRRRDLTRRRCCYATLASAAFSASRVPIVSCICAVSTYCWNLMAFPSRTCQTWQAWAWVAMFVRRQDVARAYTFPGLTGTCPDEQFRGQARAVGCPRALPSLCGPRLD